MMPRKQPTSSTPWIQKPKYSKSNKLKFYLILVLFIISLVVLFLRSFSLIRPCQKTQYSFQSYITNQIEDFPPTPPTVCDRGYSVYVYELPPEFNSALLKDCAHLNMHTNMCPHIANDGLGQPLSAVAATVDDSTWFATNQFMAERIFHARLLNHPCRTMDATMANLFYVPFYGGLHESSKCREVNLTARDHLAVRLVDFLHRQPAWRKHGGGDHFLALGRTAWDFMRNPTGSGSDYGANILLNLPLIRNMTVLIIERHPWDGTNQHGIPYPSYFHPTTSDQIVTWQKKMRESNRPYLFSFIGAPRKGNGKAAIRNVLITQCDESSQCKLVKCGSGPGKCYKPAEVMRVMTQSEFCLQAPGDSFTRRSIFDSILAGCIPVFFSPNSAYTQYGWYFPAERSSYSVYMDEKEVSMESGGGKKRLNIEEELLKIAKEKVGRMRNVVISLIPRVTYTHTNATDVWLRDAVDIALKAMAAERINSL